MAGQPPQLQRDHIHRHQLCAVGLRGRNGNLGPGVRIQHRIGLARYRGTHNVNDTNGLRTALFGFAHRSQCICRFTRLADDHDDLARRNDRVTVPKLGSDSQLQLGYAQGARSHIYPPYPHDRPYRTQ